MAEGPSARLAFCPAFCNESHHVIENTRIGCRAIWGLVPSRRSRCPRAEQWEPRGRSWNGKRLATGHEGPEAKMAMLQARMKDQSRQVIETKGSACGKQSRGGRSRIAIPKQQGLAALGLAMADGLAGDWRVGWTVHTSQPTGRMLTVRGRVWVAVREWEWQPVASAKAVCPRQDPKRVEWALGMPQ